MKRVPALRRRLESRLKRPLEEREWKLLEDLGYTTEVFEEGLDEDMDMAMQALRAAWKFSSGTGGRETPQPRVNENEFRASGKIFLGIDQLSRLETLRSSATARYLAAMADHDALMTDFRSRLGGTLDSGAAEKLLRSAAAQVLSFDNFEQLGIQLLDHKAHWPNAKQRKSLTAPMAWWDHDYVHITSSGKTRRVRWREMNDTPLVEPWPNRLTVIAPGPKFYGSGFWPGSILSDLFVLGQRLEHRYPWSATEVRWLVLTGAVLPLTPLHMGAGFERDTFKYPHVSFRVEPWVSVETLARAYRKQRDSMLAVRNRRPSEKSIKLFDFITGMIRSDGAIGSWRGAMDAWNRKYKKHYYSSVRNFHRDYDRVRRHVLPNATDEIVPHWLRKF